ncbi:MAG: hypothetical protein EHM23_35875 [Acidobacteria bacterium]|nr:MAG: hypothetical protein EHM23_35875 [Acidobacteriota bacterium]
MKSNRVQTFGCRVASPKPDPYVETVQRQLAAAAATGGQEAQALAAQLATALESAVRLALQDALASAVGEITCELAPGSVEVRLRGRDPEIVVTPPATDSRDRADPELLPALSTLEADQGAMERINLRLPATLKTRIEAVAAAGLSVNAWLVRVAALAAEGARKNDTGDERVFRDGRRYRGWAR